VLLHCIALQPSAEMCNRLVRPVVVLAGGISGSNGHRYQFFPLFVNAKCAAGIFAKWLRLMGESQTTEQRPNRDTDHGSSAAKTRASCKKFWALKSAQNGGPPQLTFLVTPGPQIVLRFRTISF
jgi:hypothetical protein